MTPTQTQDTAMLSPTEIYNILMEQIEPDLTTDMLPLLDTMYMNETVEECEKRGERYGEAFADFEVAYDAFVKGCTDFYTDLKNKAQTLITKAVKDEDEQGMAAIEDSLSQSA